MMIMGQEKPSLEELFHYGKKGMKWGIRKANPSGSEIRDARQRQAIRVDSVYAQDKKIKIAPNAKAKAAAVKTQSKLVKDFLTNEDRVTASRMTNGEKAAQVILLGPLAAVTLPLSSAYSKRVARATDQARKVR